MTMPVVVMDEAGNTGENLLDRDQPVYALAAVRMDLTVAESLVADALRRTQKTTTELKFSSLRKSNVGRKNVLTLLHDAKLTPEDAAIIVLHKPWMLAAKLIDELVEPRMLAKGVQPAWYGTGAAKNMAQALYSLGPPELGEMYNDLAFSFVSMVRDYTPEAGAVFVRTLRRCKIVCRNEQLSDLLSVMIDSQRAMDVEFGTQKDALDPPCPRSSGRAATGHRRSRLGSRCSTTTQRASGVGRQRYSTACSSTWRGGHQSRSPSARSPFTFQRF